MSGVSEVLGMRQLRSLAGPVADRAAGPAGRAAGLTAADAAARARALAQRLAELSDDLDRL